MTSTAPSQESPVLARRRGQLGELTLNRPKAINALTLPMIRVIHDTLEQWRHDPDVETVLLRGSGDRGLCAGGDVVSIWHDMRSGDSVNSAAFWREEYRLNAAIADYPKPIVAIMDGIVLGGGVGLSAHAAIRVVTERSRVGMPETVIGFFPDVGTTYLLSRAPGELGTHLALTGEPVSGADAIAVGLADHHVPAERIPRLCEALATTPAKVAVDEVAQPAPESALARMREAIDAAYRGDDPVAIRERLHASPLPAAREAAATIDSRSPTSIAVTLRALRTAAELPTLADALDMEFRLAEHFFGAPDFAEGIRAQLIDKDRDPRWSPASLAEIPVATVDSYFA